MSVYSSFSGVFIIVVGKFPSNFYQSDEHSSKVSSQCLIFITMMNGYPIDEYSSDQSVFIKLICSHHIESFITIKLIQLDSFSSQCWISIVMITFHHRDECSSKWWFFLTFDSVFQRQILIPEMNFHQTRKKTNTFLGVIFSGLKGRVFSCDEQIKKW